MIDMLLIVLKFKAAIPVFLQLLKHFRESERWVPTSSINILPNKRPSDFSPEELEHELFNLFLTTRFRPRFGLIVP